MPTIPQLQGASAVNFGHLRYFWAAARERSITRAARKLNVSQPTVSAQIRELEDTLGEQLIERSSRRFSLTGAGRTVYRYAEEIFSLSHEMHEAVRGRATGRPVVLTVGIADVVPKALAHALLQPALRLADPVQIVCLEDPTDRLLGSLAAHDVDMVLTDTPPGSANVRVYSHVLGDCGVVVLGTAALVEPRAAGFPRSLDGAPFLLPTGSTMLRRALDEWFEISGVRPKVVGEFDDTALLELFGASGAGLFAAAAPVAGELVRQHGLKRLAELPGVRERFYVLTAERRLKHPAVLALTEAARSRVFSGDAGAGPPEE